MPDVTDIDILSGGKKVDSGDGTSKIYGALIARLAALQPGEILELKGKNGRRYAILNWDDAAKALHLFE